MYFIAGKYDLGTVREFWCAVSCRTSPLLLVRGTAKNKTRNIFRELA